MPHDKRRHARYDVRLSAEFRTKAGRLETAVTKNVSVGGAALELAHAALEDGQDLELSLFLVVEGVEDPSKPPLAIGAKVMWTGEADDGSFAVGVRFERITPEQTKWLERFLEVTS
jgi:hypothetical protein